MAPTSDAEEHLRIIRSLMERATFYRAISTQAALIGGLLAGVAGILLSGRRDVFISSLSGAAQAPNAELFGFQLKWLVVLLLSGGANFYFLYRHAERRHEAFVSPGMRMALRAMTPALLCGAVFSSFCTLEGLPQAWMHFYGLALLSTSHFAPSSLVRLGWAFLLTGLALMLVDPRVLMGVATHSAIPVAEGPKAWTVPDALMAVTFGGYHIIYAACTFRRLRAATAETPAA
jgi:hypothetical protein